MGLFSFLKSDKRKQPDNQIVDDVRRIENVTQESVVEFDIIPIEERIKGKAPSCDGLHPHEILILSYAPLYRCGGENTYPRFWWYKYGIRDLTGIFESLKERGYLTTGSIKDAIGLAKLPQIKEVLKENGLKVSGKKAELVDRLISEVPEEKLEPVFTSRPYVRTEIAEQLICKYEWIPYIHSKLIEDLDIWNLTDLVLQNHSGKYRDVIWGYLNKRCMEHAQNRSFGHYRNTKLTMSEFLTEEKKLNEAFVLLCEVVIYDLNCTGNNFSIEVLPISSKYFFPYEESILTLAPGVLNRLDMIAKENNWDDDTFRKNLLESFDKFNLPFRLFTNEECAEIVFAELVEDKERVTSVYKTAEKRFKQKYKF